MKIKNFFLCAALLSAVIFGPVIVSADHTVDHTLQQLRDRFHSTFESLLTGRGSTAPGADLAFLLAAADENRVKSLENEVQSYQSRIQELKSKSQTASEAREIKLLEDEVEYVQSKLAELRSGGPNFTRTLQRGSSGNDVTKLQEVLAKDKKVYPEGLATGYFGNLTEAAVKNFQEKNGIEPVGIVGPKTRAILNGEAPGATVSILPVSSKALLTRTLQRDATGDDVRDTQELLRRFPDIYPQGSATGFYGSATESAVKKLQEKLGLPATGGVDEATKKKINELATAVERKQPPKITGVAPSEISVGTKVTITGSGFTLENNSLFVKGKTILNGLTSHDGTAIVFSVPSDIPCEVGQACPIKIVNANGISNAKPFKLVEAAPAPTPEPEPKPIPRPTPGKEDLTLLSVSPIYGKAGIEFTLTGTGFGATDNTVILSDLAAPEALPAQSSVTGLSSPDGKTLKFILPAGSCRFDEYIETCLVQVTHKNKISNTLPITIVQDITPIVLVVPNGGEAFVQSASIYNADGAKNTLKWSGGTGGSPRVALVNKSLTDETIRKLYAAGEISNSIVGWIMRGSASFTSIADIGRDGGWWNGRTVCDPFYQKCWGIEPGEYKILVISQNELGHNAYEYLGDKVFYNADVSDKPFTISPAPTPTPAPAPAPAPCVSVTLNVPEKYPTIQGAIDAANCPGTIIQIAVGTYYEILTMKSDTTLIGAGPGMTIIDGSKTPATVNPWGYLVQNFNVITAGKPGAGLKNIQIKNLSITGSGAYGDNATIRIQDSSNVLIENVLFYRNTDGLRIYSSSPVTVKNATFVGNRNGVMSHGTTNVTVKNSIITQNSAWGLYATIGVQLTSAYNAVWGNGTNYDGVISGVGDISLDPRLGSAPQYLVSSGSPTIDAGDPADAYSFEPLPNCGRINMGSYGNTQWATTCSTSTPTPPPPTAEAPTNVVAHWGSGGTGMPPVWTYSHKIKFSYATTSIANIQSFRLYQKRPGDTNFSLAATFLNPGSIAQTCSGSVRSSPWSLYYYCPPVANPPYWIAEIVNGQSASYYPIGEYDFYLAAVNTSGVEGPPSSVAVQYAVERTTIASPIGLQSIVTPTFRWTVAQSWPTLPATYSIRVASSKGMTYSANLDTTQSPEASKVYDGSPLDPSLTYSVAIFGGMVSNGRYYISMNEAPTTFQVSGTVPAAPAITSISPSYGTTGTVVKITGTGFTATDNTATFSEGFYTTPVSVSSIASADGVTLTFAVPSNLPCSELGTCSVSVKNANGTSNSISFFRTVTVVPVQVHSPNGGETIVQGQTTTLHYSGGNYGLYVGIAEEAATMSFDPSPYVLGWIWSTAPGDRTIGWDGKTLCGFPGCNSTTTKWTIGPGKYKVIASSHNEFGKTYLYDPATGKLGNFDLSDGPFNVIPAPTPTITVVSPNGGEAYKNGDAVTITWKADSIASRLVNIKLLKAGNLVQTIASNVPQSMATGLFLYNWIIPSYLTPASDYTIEISDATNAAVKDASDGQFRISNLAALQIYGPNGGEAAMRGFSALLFWTYSGYYPSTINVNLYKGGVFYRTLATGVIPVGFSGYSFLKDPYPYNSRYAEVPIALDIPDGNDYTLEIVDGVDSAILDRSDAPFRIITLPSSVTFTGRMVDALSGAPMPNISFFDWTRISTTTFITGSNGEFSFSADISSMTDPAIRNKFLSGGVPQCNDATTLSLFRYPDFLRTTFGGWYGGLYPASSVRRQYLPVTSSVMDLGDIPMWPSTDFIHTFTDIPSSFGVYYPAGGGGMGNSNYTIQHGLQNTPPLGVDIYVQYKDKAGTIYNSPTSRFSTDTRCQIATQSFMNGTYQWEPYPIGITVDWTGGGTTWSAGQAFKITLKTSALGSYYGYSAGVAPLTWDMAFGSLPPGLSLNATTGEITGTPTTVGIYSFGVKVKDANSVRASADLSITIK